jgi:hypothetical protein
MRTALLTIAVAVLCITAGCANQQPPSDQRALDTLNQTSTAVESVSSYRIDSDARVTARTGDQQRTVTLSVVGQTNFTAQQLNVTTRTGSTESTTYIDGYDGYRECGLNGPLSRWERLDLAESQQWRNFTVLGRQLAILDRTNVYWRGTETVDGAETAVIVAYPTKRDLQAVSTPASPSTTDLDDTNLQNATITLWVDTETHRPVQVRHDLVVEQRGATATATMTTRFSAYDDPIQVTSPDVPADRIWETGCPR